MKNKLEQLLNSLIEKGWTKKAHHLQGLPNKPFVRCFKDMTHGVQFYYYEWWDNEAKLVKIYSLRDIVSIDSGLWQFVCENGMINVDETEVYYFWLKRKGTLDRGHYYLSEAGEDIRTNNFEYRLIEASLKDESELESFILDNIKVDVESK